MKRFNVKDFGALGDGVTLETLSVQNAINEASRCNGEVYFPEGNYVLSTIDLLDNTHINISKDAIILGADNFYKYRMQENLDYPLYQDQSHSYFDCSLFVAKNVKNISIYGGGVIDMRSIWDEDNVRDIVHRGPKCIALKECDNIEIKDISIKNATDLAVYFAGCNDVVIKGLDLYVYIDGISPDCSKRVLIEDCNVESGDDGIVFKSSYTLNRLETCEDIIVRNCSIKSRCNAIKFGTESNGGFKNITIENVSCFNSRITGISLESVDGAIIDNIKFKNIEMKNVGSPIFVHLGERMRGPDGLSIGSISNVFFENIKATGPYELYKAIPWNYVSYKNNDVLQFPGIYSKDFVPEIGTWQITSNVCGLIDHPLNNIRFKNIYFEVDGGVNEFSTNVSENRPQYPEVNAYGRILPASGIFFRHIKNLFIDNVIIKTLHQDKREELFMVDCD